MRDVYLDAVGLDSDEAAERVSQWVWREIGGIDDCSRLLVGRHFDVYVRVDEESKSNSWASRWDEKCWSARGVTQPVVGPGNLP